MVGVIGCMSTRNWKMFHCPPIFQIPASAQLNTIHCAPNSQVNETHNSLKFCNCSIRFMLSLVDFCDSMLAYYYMYTSSKDWSKHIHTHTHTHTYIHIDTFMYMHTHTHIHTYAYMCKHECIYTHSHIHKHTYIDRHAYAHTYIHTYMHTIRTLDHLGIMLV